MSTKEVYFTNPNVLIAMDHEGYILCDTFSKREFSVDESYVLRLKEWYNGQALSVCEMDEELLAAGLISQAPIPVGEWGGHRFARFMHVLTRNDPSSMPLLTEEEASAAFLGYSAEKGEMPARPRPRTSDLIIDLPTPDIDALKNVSQWQTLKERMTCRNFKGESITLTELSTVLYASLGYIHGDEWPELKNEGLRVWGIRRSSPSGTGSAACDGYVFIQRVEGVVSGLYWYNAEKEQLWMVDRTFDEEKLVHVVIDQFWIKGLAFGVFIVADQNLFWEKCTFPRGYILSFFEAGHISQTLQLVATGLGLQTWLTANFRDNIINDAIGLDGSRCFALGFVGVGHAEKTPLPQKMKEMLNA